MKDAEGVALEAVAVLEAVLEEGAHQRLRLGEGGDAVAHVSRREHAHVLAQAAGGAAVVADGDDGGEVGGVLLEAEELGEAGAAADRDDARAAAPKRAR